METFQISLEQIEAITNSLSNVVNSLENPQPTVKQDTFKDVQAVGLILKKIMDI